MNPTIRPAALRPGDRVDVIALSGPQEPDERPLLDRGVAELEALGFTVRVSSLATSGSRWRWAAAHPDDLAEELNQALRNPDVRAIVALTGGRATAGYLDLVDYDAIEQDPKPILGFSDISSLLLAIHQRTGVATFHAELGVHGFGKWADLETDTRNQLADRYRRILTTPEPAGDLPQIRPWETWREGRAHGPLVGGMLNRIVRGQAGPYALEPHRWDGAVLFWEEAWASTAGIWLDLHTLRQTGILDRISAMIIGAPHDLQSSTSEPDDLRDIVLDVLADRDIPVLGNVDIGHTLPNLPLPLGIRAEVDASHRSLKLLEPAVTHPA